MEEAGEAALEVEKEEAAKAKGGEKEGQAAMTDYDESCKEVIFH